MKHIDEEQLSLDFFITETGRSEKGWAFSRMYSNQIGIYTSVDGLQFTLVCAILITLLSYNNVESEIDSSLLDQKMGVGGQTPLRLVGLKRRVLMMQFPLGTNILLADASLEKWRQVLLVHRLP